MFYTSYNKSRAKQFSPKPRKKKKKQKQKRKQQQKKPSSATISESNLSKVKIDLNNNETDNLLSSSLSRLWEFPFIMALGNCCMFCVDIQFIKAIKQILDFKHQQSNGITCMFKVKYLLHPEQHLFLP